MKRAIYSFILITCLGVSCTEESTEGISRITYYPVFDITGEPEVFSQVGVPYVDPGVEATEAGKPIEVVTTFIGNYFGVSGATLDPSAADKYDVEYSAVNVDGYRVSAARTVWLVGEGNFASNIEGLYISTVSRNGVTPGAANNLKYIVIKKTGANTYALSDCIGGWYEYYRVFGVNYAATGTTFTVNDIATNSTTSTSVVPMGLFGGECSIQGITFDVANKKISLTSRCAGSDFDYTFVSALTQVDLPF